MGIPRTIEKVLASTPEAHPATIAEVLARDREARRNGSTLLAWLSCQGSYLDVAVRVHLRSKE